MAEAILPARFLFRIAAPCLYRGGPLAPHGLSLGPEFRLPALAELEGARTYADVRMAWSEAGLALWMRVEGKRHAPWCRENRLEDSDSLQLWIDTRDTKNVHRAGRFCHRFIFLPQGGGRNLDQPLADQLLVDRARENASPVRPGMLGIECAKRTDGYEMSIVVPAAALTGFNPADNPRLGFNYLVFDRELGEQSFNVGTDIPFASDPSLWGTLELTPAKPVKS